MTTRIATKPTLRRSRRTCRVLIVDDSVVARQVLAGILAEDDRFEVIAESANAGQALKILTDLPCDIVLLDIEMPGMNGLDAIPLMRDVSDAAILVLSSHCSEGTEASVRAMTLGATETLHKPPAREFAAGFAEGLIRMIGRIADARCSLADASDDSAQTERAHAGMLARPVRCLAVGASTGGVHATIEFLGAISRDIAMPILVTQHLPPDFIDPFARQMRLATGREFEPARDGQKLAPGQVLVAPGNAHLTITADGDEMRVRFRRHDTASGCMPSVDPMLETVAAMFGRDAVGVILSGMGRDGREGAGYLAARGGEVLAQDSGSAVVWGMPGSVVGQGSASLVAAPTELGAHVSRRAGAQGWR